MQFQVFCQLFVLFYFFKWILFIFVLRTGSISAIVSFQCEMWCLIFSEFFTSFTVYTHKSSTELIRIYAAHQIERFKSDKKKRAR
jgi:hypothetical protein